MQLPFNNFFLHTIIFLTRDVSLAFSTFCCPDVNGELVPPFGARTANSGDLVEWLLSLAAREQQSDVLSLLFITKNNFSFFP